jgi:transcriptional regulator with XRE-family HTH domain
VPSARALLGDALRQARTKAGIAQPELARQLGVSQPMVSRIEHGHRAPSREQVTRWLDITQAPGDSRGVALELFAAAADEHTTVTEWSDLQQAGWTQHQERYRDLAGEATLIRIYQSAMVPGILQTPDYVAYLMRHVLAVPETEFAAATEARLRRQEILYAPGSHLEVVLAEAALRQPFGGRALMASQLDRLAALAHLPSIDVAVLPVDTDMPDVHTAAFWLYEMPQPSESEVLIELLLGEVRETDPARVSRYRTAFHLYRQHSLAGEAAIKMIQRIAREMRHAAPDQPPEGANGEDS